MILASNSQRRQEILKEAGFNFKVITSDIDKNREDAFRILKTLSGKFHKVITAYVFKNISKNILIKEVVVSEVKFFDLDDEIINWYLDTNEPFDKAGAYGIQGHGRILIEKINGDYYSIMGFPISNFLKNLRKIGYKISQIDKI